MEQRNLLLAIVLAILVMIAYTQLVERGILPGKIEPPPAPETETPAQAPESGTDFEIPVDSEPAPIEPSFAEPDLTPAAEPVPGEDILVKTQLYTAVFGAATIGLLMFGLVVGIEAIAMRNRPREAGA